MNVYEVENRGELAIGLYFNNLQKVMKTLKTEITDLADDPRDSSEMGSSIKGLALSAENLCAELVTELQAIQKYAQERNSAL